MNGRAKFEPPTPAPKAARYQSAPRPECDLKTNATKSGKSIPFFSNFKQFLRHFLLTYTLPRSKKGTYLTDCYKENDGRHTESQRP